MFFLSISGTSGLKEKRHPFLALGGERVEELLSGKLGKKG